MLFKKRFWPGIRDGSLTVTFRRWKSARVIAGRRYRTPGGVIEITGVEVIRAADLTDAAATAAGYPSAADLLRDLPRAEGDLFRVDFRTVQEDDPRDLLAADATPDHGDVLELANRLARLDRASRHGPWTTQTLRAIADAPGVRAGDLATALGRDREPLKVDIRKLKNLGLTISLEVGYMLSPRGEAYMRHLDS